MHLEENYHEYHRRLRRALEEYEADQKRRKLLKRHARKAKRIIRWQSFLNRIRNN